MWLIMFTPANTNTFVPQILCRSEQEAKDWIRKAPFSVVGSYSYMYVPMASMGNYWTRQEPWQFPGYDWPNPYPYYVQPERRQWQYEVGDWPDSTPKITC